MVRERAGGEVDVRSAGVSRNAETRVDGDLLRWADRVYVMMEGIRKRIEQEFPDISEGKASRSSEYPTGTGEVNHG